MIIDLWYLEEIREAVNSPETADQDLLGEAAIAYADACRDANVRLREVDGLLRRGLRAEAIQVAEREPGLVDVIAELDFPLLEEWQEMLIQWGMQLPPQLQMEIAGRLNAAYAEQMPLESLFRRHRMLALARAPLPARLNVLRQIRKQDADNPAWPTDVEQYERQRVKQLSTDISAAERRGDLGALTELVEEVESPDWERPVPKELVDLSRQQFNQLRARLSRQALLELLPQMDRAYSEFDATRASLLAKQWREHAEFAGLPSDDSFVQQAAPVLEWTAQQEQSSADERDFRGCLAKLERALDDDAPRDKLEKLYRKAQQFDQSIPRVIELRVKDKLDALQLGSRRRFILYTSALSILLVAGGAALILYWQQLRTDRTALEHSAALSRMIDAESLNEAEKYHARLTSNVQNAPAVAELQSRLQQLKQTERERLAAIAELLQRGEAMSVDKPDYALLKQIEDTAKLPEEQNKLTVLKLRITRRQQEMQDERDRAFTKTVSVWSERLAALDARTVPNGQLEPAWLRSMMADLQASLNRHGTVSSSVRRQGDTLTAKMNAIIDREKSLSNQKASLASIFEAVGNVDAYSAALKKFATEFPNTVYANDAASVIEEEKAWRSVLAWSQFWKEHGTNWQQLTPDRAKQIVEIGDKLAKEQEYNDLSAAFLDRKPYLEAIVARKDVDLSSLKSFLLQNPLIADTWILVDKNNKRYYCPEQPTESLGDSTSQIIVTVFNDAGLNTHKRSFTRGNVEIRLSPQSALVAGEKDQHIGLRALLTNLSDNNWDSTYYRMAQAVRDAATPKQSSNESKSEPELDPILAMDMLRRVLKTGSQGSYLFKQAFGSVAEEIENAGVDLSVSWFLPNDEQADSTRQEAKAIVAGLADFKTLTEQTRQSEGSKKSPPADEYRWIAAIERTGDEQVVCKPPLDESSTGTLCAVSIDIGQHVVIHEIGYVDKGNVSWSPGGLSTVLVTGRPVFLRGALQPSAGADN